MLLVVAAGWRLAFAAVSASMDRAGLLFPSEREIGVLQSDLLTREPGKPHRSVAPLNPTGSNTGGVIRLVRPNLPQIPTRVVPGAPRAIAVAQEAVFSRSTQAASTRQDPVQVAQCHGG